MWHEIAAQISSSMGQVFTISSKNRVSGGDINDSYQISDGKSCFFVKLNNKDKLEMFEAEAYGLEHLARLSEFRVPRVIASGCTLNHSYLVLEFISMHEPEQAQWESAGRTLANMHLARDFAMHGWDNDNYLGTNLQPNGWHKKWSLFFAEERIGWQLQLLKEKGHHPFDSDDVVEAIHQRLLHHKVEPSLLHGDLWKGNLGFNKQVPVLFDPACYVGDAEAELAMTQLFGGFPERFYAAYHEVLPMHSGYEERKHIYNLYHLLNHANLFGEQYLVQAKQIIEKWVL